MAEFTDAFSTAFDATADTDSGCAWPVSYAACNDCPDAVMGDDADVWEAMASDLLGRWTGGVFGLCPVTVRPCRGECMDRRSTYWGRGPFPWGSGRGWTPYLIDGKWYNAYCGGCGQAAGCGCQRGPSVSLPGPIVGPVSVKIDGETLDDSAYRVEGRFLIRTDGEEWPRCQDMDADDDAVGTWSVTYTRGIEVPVGGQVAAGLLACELAKAACGDPSCGLPQRIQSVTRQGVTVAVLDSFDDIESGRTGIWLIDSWVASITKPRRRGRVMSPDYRMGR